MQTLDELLARVEAATGPDRELDALIAAAFRIHWTSPDHWINRSSELEFRPMGPGGWRDGWLEIWMPGESGPRDKWKAHEYTRSIDAAKSLKDKLLPGQAMAMGDMAFTNHPKGPWATIWTLDGSPQFNAEAATPALAIILALLRALRSKGEV